MIFIKLDANKNPEKYFIKAIKDAPMENSTEEYKNLTTAIENKNERLWFDINNLYRNIIIHTII